MYVCVTMAWHICVTSVTFIPDIVMLQYDNFNIDKMPAPRNENATINPHENPVLQL